MRRPPSIAAGRFENREDVGGLDVMVFSGRYAHAGSLLGPWLGERLCFGGEGSEIPWLCFDAGLPRLMADGAAAVVRSAASDPEI